MVTVAPTIASTVVGVLSATRPVSEKVVAGAIGELLPPHADTSITSGTTQPPGKACGFKFVAVRSANPRMPGMPALRG
jgi:hypothetical protein